MYGLNQRDDPEAAPLDSEVDAAPANRLLPAEPLAPIARPKEGPDYRNVIGQSFRFLFLEQAFRYATEEGTRHPGTSFIGGYTSSVTNLHGWADGDPFIVNYVGHPMQGAVAGRIWIQNDPRYKAVRFGKNRDYWRSRLRAAGFAFLYSEQFEIGLLSEASIGATQRYFPQQGLVDHVVTPTVGLGWIIVEDAIDKYLIEWVESRTKNPYYKLLIRGGLNPTRSFANALAGELPWHRQSRAGVFGSSALRAVSTPTLGAYEPDKRNGPAPFQFTVSPSIIMPLGSESGGACVGGGGEAGVRLSANTQVIANVSGCKWTDLGANKSGDMLLFMAGPRIELSTTGRWVPYAQLLFGGIKVSTEEMFPAVKNSLANALAEQGRTLDFTDHNSYTRQADSTAFALSFGSGISRKLTDALAWEVASVEYTHRFAGNPDTPNYRSLFQVKSGLTLRMGTW